MMPAGAESTGAPQAEVPPCPKAVNVSRRSNAGSQPRSGGATASDLREWNTLLIERLVGSDAEPLLDQLVTHPVFAGRESAALKELLAR